MRFSRSRKIPAIDADHMKALHEECVDQLALMTISLDAAQLAGGPMRDRLDDIAQAHWNSYIEVVHLLCLHDESLGTAVKKTGLALRADADDAPEPYQEKRALLRALTQALLCHHRRMACVYEHRSEPARSDLTNAAAPDREYIALLLEMVHNTL